MHAFTLAQHKKIEEKVKQLWKIDKGGLSVQELADMTTKRRVDWFEENKEAVLETYIGLPLPEIAYRTIFLSHMGIDPQSSKFSWVSENKLRIESYNFCPYLEACLIVRLDPGWLCKAVGEPSIQKLCHLIDPRLKFSRNYRAIRPYQPYCEEFIELVL